MMREDQIRELLRRADGEVESAVVPAVELAGRVRDIDRRRRRRRRVVVAALPLVLFIAATVAWPWWNRGSAVVEVQPPAIADAAKVAPESNSVGKRMHTSDVIDESKPADADQPIELTDDEYAQLAAEAELQLLVARRLITVLQHERVLEEARRAMAEEDPLDEARRRIDTVAYRMILRADRLRDSMQPPDEAIAIYEEVLQLFPTTYSAEVARQRLAALMN